MIDFNNKKRFSFFLSFHLCPQTVSTFILHISINLSINFGLQFLNVSVFHAANLFINFTYVWIYIHTFSYTANLNISLCASRAELIFPMNHTWTLVILFDCFEQSGNLLFWLHWKNWSCSKLQTNFHKNQPIRSIFRRKKSHTFQVLAWAKLFKSNFHCKKGNFYLKYFIYWLLEAIFLKRNTHSRRIVYQRRRKEHKWGKN